MTGKPHVLILGGNFAGLGAAQKIRDHAGDAVDITVIDRKAYLDYIPNIPLEIFEGRDPAVTMHMPLVETLAREKVQFRQAEVLGLDLDARQVGCARTNVPERRNTGLATTISSSRSARGWRMTKSRVSPNTGIPCRMPSTPTG